MPKKKEPWVVCCKADGNNFYILGYKLASEKPSLKIARKYRTAKYKNPEWKPWWRFYESIHECIKGVK